MICFLFSFHKEKPGSADWVFRNKPQPFGLQPSLLAWRRVYRQGVPLLAETEPAAKAEQCCRRAADVVNGTGNFMARQPFRCSGAFNPCAARFVRRAASDQIKAAFGSKTGRSFKSAQRAESRSQHRRRQFPLELLCAVGLSSTPVQCAMLYSLYKYNGIIPHPVPKSQTTSLRRGAAKITEQEGVGSKPVVVRNANLHSFAKVFKPQGMIHAAGLLSGTDEDELPSSAPLSEAEETLSPEKGLSDTSGSCETKDGCSLKKPTHCWTALEIQRRRRTAYFPVYPAFRA